MVFNGKSTPAWFQGALWGLLVFLASWGAQASEYIYRSRVNWVKLDDMSSDQVGERMANHPAKFSETQMIALLQLMAIDKRYLIKNEINSQYIFSEEEARRFAPHLVEGLATATPYQSIVFSVVHKRPLFILRNDRLTWGEMWMSGDGLHFKFIKIFAKLEGDYEAPGRDDRVRKAKGLRVTLASGPGQMYGETGTDELVFDPNFDYVAALAATPMEVSPSGKVTPKEDAIPAPSSPVTASPAARTPAERLRELDALQKDGLVTKGEYEQIRQRILQGL